MYKFKIGDRIRFIDPEYPTMLHQTGTVLDMDGDGLEIIFDPPYNKVRFFMSHRVILLEEETSKERIIRTVKRMYERQPYYKNYIGGA